MDWRVEILIFLAFLTGLYLGLDALAKYLTEQMVNL